MPETTIGSLSRRTFLGTAAASGATVAVGTAIPWTQLHAQIQTLKDEGWEARPTTCNVCGAYCGLLVMHKKGTPTSRETIRIMPNPDHPQRGYCGRGAQAFYVWDHPLRIKQPMKRTGARGEGKFEPISWDQALTEIADRVKAIVEKDGEHAIAMTSHNFSGMQKWFSTALGSPNQISHSSSCNTASAIGRRMVFGKGYEGVGKVDPDYENARYLLCFGRTLNCAMGVNSVVARAREGGLKVVFVDPRMPEGSLTGAQWAPVRPGTDAAFILGMIHIGIKENYADTDWMMRHTNAAYLAREDGTPITQADVKQDGSASLFAVIDAATQTMKFQGVKTEDGKAVAFIEDGSDLDIHFQGEITLLSGEKVQAKTAFVLLEESAARYTPGMVTQITGYPTRDFIELTHEFFRKKGVADDGWYSARNGNDSTTFALYSILNLLQGHFDKKGGLIVTQGGGFGGVGVSAKGKKAKGPAGQTWELSDGKRLDTVYYPESMGTISAAYNAILTGKPYPIRSLFITGSTMFHREAHTPSMIKALMALDLVVVQDLFPHEIVDYADYILPSTYFLESREYSSVKWARDGYVQINDTGIEPPADVQARDEIWQFCEILRRAYPDRASERLGYNHELKTRKEFRAWYDGMMNKAWGKFIAKKNEARPGDGDRIAKQVAEQGFAASMTKKYEVFPYKKPMGTPTGKPELVSFYIAQKFHNKGLAAIHDYIASPGWTAPKAPDEFFLVSGKDGSASCGTTVFTKPSQHIGDRTLWMNPVDGERLHISNGETVELESLDTKEKGRMQVKLTNRVMAGSLFAYAFQGDVRTKHLAKAKGYEWIKEGLCTNRLCTPVKESLTGAACNNCSVRVIRL